MITLLRRKPIAMLAAGLSLGLLVGLGMMLGAIVALSSTGPTFLLPETPLQATATHGGETLAVATGPIDSEAEGLFMLDFLTGDLQCAVIYTRGANPTKFGAVLRANVQRDLGAVEAGKRPKYLMVTGQVNFVRGAGVTRPGMCVVYVVDENTGRVAAYGVPWDPQAAARGAPQQGNLLLLDVAQARTALIRD